MLVSLVFSFRNEEDNIPALVQRVATAVGQIDDCDYELVFVNDQSTDRSLELLLALKKDYPIRVLNMSRRFGVTPCRLAGLAHAKGDAIITMDADLQDPPELIGDMVVKFRAGADVVHMTRTSREGESPFKMGVTKMAYKIINAFSNIDLPDNTGDFKLLSRRAAQKVLELPEYDPYWRGLAVWIGYNQAFVRYRRSPRHSGETHFPLLSKAPLREFIRGITSFSAAPLYFAALFGFLAIGISIALAAYALVTKLMGIATQGSSGVLIALAFFSGVIMLTNGVIGIYVARIYNEVKRRPRYIIQEVID